MNIWSSIKRREPSQRRRWLAPEVIQTSAMDCGPAALKCLLEGHGIQASYGRLREACQTSVDGTSIDMIETVAQQLGLDAEQVMLPRDHVWVPEANALPAMVAIRQPNALTHFVIVWRRHGRWVQIMDPGVGRRWTTCRLFTGELFPHRQNVSAADWYEWAVSDESIQVMRARLRALGVAQSAAEALIEKATQENHWYAMAGLDAAVRLLGALADGGGVRRGQQAMNLLQTLVTRTAREAPGTCAAIPHLYWSVMPAENEELILRGAVLLRIRGRSRPVVSDGADDRALAPELRAALTERAVRPMRELWSMVRADGVLTPAALAAAIGVAMGALVFEALLFRGLFELSRDLSVAGQRAVAFAALLGFTLLLWMFEFPIVAETQRLGRRLESRLRLALLRKLPLLNDRYFQSRPISDVAERAHSIHLSRHLPELAARLMRVGWELLFTLVGIAVLDPGSLPLAASIAVLAVGLLIAAQPLLSERDLRARSHAGALHSFYLDALLGIAPIRAHSAERSVRREHEGLLAEWARAARSALRPTLLVKAVQSLICMSLMVWLLARHLRIHGITGDLLLLVYWVVKLPALAEMLATLVAQYPAQRNIALRLLEPLKAPEQAIQEPKAAESTATKRGPHRVNRVGPGQGRMGSYARPAGVAIDMQGVAVVAAGHVILQDVDLSIRPGEHIAVVGPSGAGKSSLLGLLLGWHRAAAGTVRIDGDVLAGERLLQLRARTAWLDPAVQLWNRTLLDNLRYSPDAGSYSSLAQVLESADLVRLLIAQPEGLQSVLAEGGTSVSGGEGQRLRLARALWQRDVRLALLDEPFRGLDREQRHRHLAFIRDHWREATLVCVTHDVGETRAFPRVLVVEDGRIVEDGRPEELAAAAGSRYRHLMEVEESLRLGVWNAALWRRVRLEGGRVQESNRVLFTARSAAGHE